MTAPIPLTGAEPCRQVLPDLFFPEPGDRRGARDAAALCRDCPVLLPCLTYAVKHEKHGVWAGTTPKDRQKLRLLGSRRTTA